MSKALDWIRVNYRSYLLWALFWSILIVPFLLALISLSIQEREAGKRRLPEVIGIADQIPVYPGFQKFGDDSFSLAGSRVSLQRTFRTNDQFADIRRFYDVALANSGWGSHEIRSSAGEPYFVTYHRGPYEFGIEEYSPNQYSIWVLWIENRSIKNEPTK